jgi:CubicO group peptidase (beta-lactamase class C family)
MQAEIMVPEIGRRQFLLSASHATVGSSLLALAGTTRAQAAPAGSTDDAASRARIADWERSIPRIMAEFTVPGLSIVVIRNGRMAWRRGFGVKDAASKAPVANNTMFEAASMSKPLFAYAVMKLCKRGVIGLDTPLTKYTTERFLEGDPRLDLITARCVLSHTTGFPNWRSAAEPLKINFTPGEKWSYSGEGYSLYLLWQQVQV